MAPIQTNYGYDVELISSHKKFLLVTFSVAVFVCTLSIVAVICACQGKKREMKTSSLGMKEEKVPVGQPEKWPKKEEPEMLSLKSASCPAESEQSFSRQLISVSCSTIKPETESQRDAESMPYGGEYARTKMQPQSPTSNRSYDLQTLKSDDKCVATDGLTILPDSEKNSNDRDHVPSVKSRSLRVDLSTKTVCRSFKTSKNSPFLLSATN